MSKRVITLKGVKGIPNEVRITSKVTYDIVWQKNVIVGSDKSSAFGYTCSQSKIIFLKMGMSPRLARKTLIHEILHALEDEYKFRLPHSAVYLLEGPLEAVLRLNRGL